MSSSTFSSDFNYTPTFPGILKQALANGYNLLHATLEFTDNSISKHTSNLQVILDKTDVKPYLLNRITVIDDGDGMTSQGLKESFIIANSKSSREDNDIGSFCVGMKYAAMNLGTSITLISKVEGGLTVGLHANIEQMKINNSFRPTEFCESVDEEWSKKYLSNGLFEKFITMSHGTMIHISNLRTKASINYESALEELVKGLTVAYSSLYNDCKMSLYDSTNLHKSIHPIDLFYQSSPEKLDKDPYETSIEVYRGDNGIERVIEKNIMRRSIPKCKKYGHPDQPLYVEWLYHETKKGQKKLSTKILTNESLPEKADLIGCVTTRTIQVKEEHFSQEKKYFPEGTPLHRDRKRFWFHRDIRCVAAGNTIGKKIHDRTGHNTERQRTQVKFPPSLDEVIGSKFNKQMDDKELPCRLLGDVIFEIHKKVTNLWDKEWEENTTLPSRYETSSDEEQSETSSPPSPDTANIPTVDDIQEQTVSIPTVDIIEEIQTVVTEPNETVPDVPEVTVISSKEDAFQKRFGITLERYSEMSEWLKQYDSI